MCLAVVEAFVGPMAAAPGQQLLSGKGRGKWWADGLVGGSVDRAWIFVFYEFTIASEIKSVQNCGLFLALFLGGGPHHSGDIWRPKGP